jgi:ABC-type uncharacterized transport system substrate-binding protein
MIGRREVITLLGGVAVAWPLAAHAEQRAIPVLGLMSSGSLANRERHLAVFHRALAETGYVVGRNVAIESRWADSQYDRLPVLAAELIQRQVSAIVYFGAVNGALAAKAATRTIPVVFLIGSDPVEFGLVASLNRPAGNLTGITLIIREMSAKRMQIIREAIPGVTTIGLLVNPNNRNTDSETREVNDAARSLGVELHVVNASTKSDIEAAFATLVQLKAGAFLTTSDAFFTEQRDQIAVLAARHGVSGITHAREYAEAGGLMSYGSDQADAFRLLGSYTGRVLKGEKPADLPVQQSVKVELVINLKTAKALGLEVPATLLARAEEIIE